MNETLIKHTPIFDLVEKQDDCNIGFNPVGINAPDWVTVIVEKDGKYLMTKQLRYGLMHECEEFCAGQVDKDEPPFAAAQRELMEETGYVVPSYKVIELGNFAANPAFMNNHMHYFYMNLNDGDYEMVDTCFDEHEKLTSYWKDKDKVVKDCFKNHDSVFMPAAFFLMNLHELAIS